jgi:hypothetical protein
MLVSTRNPLQVMDKLNISLYLATSIHDISTSHTHKLNFVTIYILWYCNAVELMGTECSEEYFKQEEGRDKDEREIT